MAYLIDASSLIEAKDRYYSFDICPGYWDWLRQQNASGMIFSIDRVFQELDEIEDELTAWARGCGPGFFLQTDPATVIAVGQINDWIVGENFKSQAQTEFFRGADPFLIAYALAHHHTVVTDEIHVEGEKKRVKIPTVCRQFNIPCINPFEMMRQAGLQFVISS